MTAFAALSLHERLLKAVATLGFAEPTAVQLAAIPPALAGGDLHVTAQTGSGKTAAFVLPTLHRLLQESRARTATRVLILLPTRELALQTLQQVELLAQFTFIKATLVTGGEDFKKQAAALRRNPEIVIGTPGRLLEQRRAGHLELGDLEVLILDEADRMLDMGFSDDVLALVDACSAQRQTLLFSATAGGGALHDLVGRILREPQRLRVHAAGELSATTRQQIITADDAAHKEKILLWLLAHETYAKAMVFTNTREHADRLGGVLITAHQAGQSQAKVYVLHGEKDQKDRRQALSRLNQGHINVLIATDVAARGLDIEGMDLVINFDMPRKGDDYLHRIGRTGRAGAEGLAISLVTPAEWNLMSSIERYLKQRFEKRFIKAVRGAYTGPKKLKASGKAVGSKQKKTSRLASRLADKSGARKPAKKPSTKRPTARSRPAAEGGGQPLRDGNATLRRRPPEDG